MPTFFHPVTEILWMNFDRHISEIIFSHFKISFTFGHQSHQTDTNEKTNYPPHFFKRQALKAFLGACFTLVLNISHAQTQWKIDGNTVTSDSKLGTNTGYDLIIETANAERLRVTDAGYIGIGIVNPDEKLHLIGDFKILGDIKLGNWDDPTADEKRFTYVDHNGVLKHVTQNGMLEQIHLVDCFVKPGQTYPSPAWQSTADAESGILFTGNSCPARVGIGTNSPLAELDVAGGLIRSGGLVIGNPSLFDTEQRLVITTSFPLTTNIFNVGSHGEIQSRFMGTTQNPFAIKQGNTENDLFKVSNQGALEMNYTGATDNTLVMQVRSETDDQAIFALTGYGKVYCEGITVKHAPVWGDYVFDETYTKMPLNELEQFIQTKKHLPDVPDAEEVCEKGLDVSVMLQKMMVKIEELTLYTIDQQKEIDALKHELSTIKK